MFALDAVDPSGKGGLATAIDGAASGTVETT
jgi:hypothetical protein